MPKRKLPQPDIAPAILPEIIGNFYRGMVMADGKGKIIYRNRTAKKILNIHPAEQRRELQELIKATLRYKNELVADVPSGDYVYRFHSQYILEKNKPWIAVTIKDVTEEWRTEKQQDVLEHTANFAVGHLPLREWLKSLLGKILVANKLKNTAVIIGNNDNIEFWIASDSAAQVQKIEKDKEILNLYLKKKTPVSIPDISKQKKYKDILGEEPGSVLCLPMQIENKVVGALIIKDKPRKLFREQDRLFFTILASRLGLIIEHSLLLERLEREHAKLLAVITNTNQGKVLIGSLGQILITNPAFAELLQTKIENLKDKKIIKVLPELKEILETEQTPLYHVLRLESLPGKPWVGIYVSRINRGGIINIVLTIRDITAEKHLEQLKNDFISTATHELRTPLTAILGYLSMLENRGGLDEKQSLYIQRVQKASNNLFELVEDLLAVLRIEQEKMGLKPRRLKLLSLVKEVVHGLEPKIIKKKIKVSLPSKDHSIYTDTNALQRVLVNLIDNAIKYSRPRAKISITFKKDTSQKYIKVGITDTGVGIPKKEQEKIFEKFHRVPNEFSVEAGGTGLGLYISRQLAEQWGGEIKLARSGARGSTFQLTIPASKRYFVHRDQRKAL